MTDSSDKDRPKLRSLSRAARLVAQGTVAPIPRLWRPLPPSPPPTGKLKRVAEAKGAAGPELRELFRGVDAFPWIGVYVHGSWADETMTAFSDLDDLVVIYDAPRRGTRDLKQLQRWLNVVDLRFIRMDPLQHHGHWIVHADELAHLDESYLPLLVVEGAVVVQGTSRIEAVIDEASTRQGLERNLDRTLGSIAVWAHGYSQGELTLYAAKHLISAIALLPAYVLQLRGGYLSKAKAIRVLRDAVSPDAKKALDWATEARLGWGAVLKGTGYQFLKVESHLVRNPNLHRHIAARYSPRLDATLLPTLEIGSVESLLAEASSMARP